MTGFHITLYSKAPEADLAFFHDILGFRAVDIDAGWLTFNLPAAKSALDASNGRFVRIQARVGLLGVLIYFMCDRLEEVKKSLEARNITCSRIYVEPWGTKAFVQLPSGGEIGLYQPAHSGALNLESN
jgi:catechol 2,3-dioxygenase-like lactoylglutathione lyase family enzyme